MTGTRTIPAVTTAPAEWPTFIDLEPALDAAQTTFDELEFAKSKYTALLDPNFGPPMKDGVKAPSFQEVGAAAVFVARLELGVEQIVDIVKEIKELVDTAALEGGVA